LSPDFYAPFPFASLLLRYSFLRRYAAHALLTAIFTARLLRTWAKQTLACLMSLKVLRLVLGWPGVSPFCTKRQTNVLYRSRRVCLGFGLVLSSQNCRAQTHLPCIFSKRLTRRKNISGSKVYAYDFDCLNRCETSNWLAFQMSNCRKWVSKESSLDHADDEKGIYLVSTLVRNKGAYKLHEHLHSRASFSMPFYF